MTEGYHYTACGLDYVYLQNGYDVHETKHGKGISVRNAGGLHDAIARAIIEHLPRLRGQEVRFLRAQLNLSQAGLAKILQTRRGTVARWEGRPNQAITGTADTALRLFYAAKADGHATAQRIVELLTEIDEIEHKIAGVKEAVAFRETAGEWQPELMAA